MLWHGTEFMKIQYRISNEESGAEEIQSGSISKKRKRSKVSTESKLFTKPKRRKFKEQTSTEPKKSLSSSERTENFRKKWKEREDEEEKRSERYAKKNIHSESRYNGSLGTGTKSVISIQKCLI